MVESPTDFLLDDDDDECERLSSNFAETDTEDDKPAISEEDLELVDISSDEDGNEDDLGSSRPSFAVDIFRDWIRGPPVAIETVEVPVPEVPVPEVTIPEVPVPAPEVPVSEPAPPAPPVTEAEAVEDDEYEELRLRRLRGDDRRRGGRGREAAPERDVLEDDTETAEFQSRLRKLSNPSAVPGSEVQNVPEEAVADPIKVKSEEVDTAPGVTQQGPAPGDDTPAEDPNPAKRLKSRDLFEIKRRHKQQGARPPPPPPAGRRGSWHLESVDELAPLLAAGPIEKLQEEEGEQEEGGEEEEADRESKTSSGSKEASPGEDSGGKGSSPPPRLFRWVLEFIT